MVHIKECLPANDIEIFNTVEKSLNNEVENFGKLVSGTDSCHVRKKKHTLLGNKVQSDIKIQIDTSNRAF